MGADHPRTLRFDVLRADPVEQTDFIPEQHGGEVDLQLVEQSGLDERLDDVRAARDPQVLIAREFAPIRVDDGEMMKPRVTLRWMCAHLALHRVQP